MGWMTGFEPATPGATVPSGGAPASENVEAAHAPTANEAELRREAEEEPGKE